MTVTVEAYQNEELQRTLIPNALRSGGGVDLFQQWGAGELAAQVEAGYVMDITDEVGRRARCHRRHGRAVAVRRRDLRPAVQLRHRGLLVQQGPVRAGRHRGHADDAGRAERRRRQAQGRRHRADRGGRRRQVAGRALLVQLRAEVVLARGAAEGADGPRLRRLLPRRRASSCRTSSHPTRSRRASSPPPPSRAPAARPACRQRQGRDGAHGPLGPRRHGRHHRGGDRRRSRRPRFLGWFNFPGIDGAEGDPTAALGGGDGFSCAARAPPECVELLKYISSVDVQTALRRDRRRPARDEGLRGGHHRPEPAAGARRSPPGDLRAALAGHRLRPDRRRRHERRHRRPVRRKRHARRTSSSR